MARPFYTLDVFADRAFAGNPLAVVLEAVRRLGRRSLRNGPLRAIAAAAFIAIFLFAAPFPLIVIGLFAYAVVVLPMKRFSAYAGGLALGVLMVPTVARSAEELLAPHVRHCNGSGGGRSKNAPGDGGNIALGHILLCKIG